MSRVFSLCDAVRRYDGRNRGGKCQLHFQLHTGEKSLPSRGITQQWKESAQIFAEAVKSEFQGSECVALMHFHDPGMYFEVSVWLNFANAKAIPSNADMLTEKLSNCLDARMDSVILAITALEQRKVQRAEATRIAQEIADRVSSDAKTAIGFADKVSALREALNTAKSQISESAWKQAEEKYGKELVDAARSANITGAPDIRVF